MWPRRVRQKVAVRYAMAKGVLKDLPSESEHRVGVRRVAGPCQVIDPVFIVRWDRHSTQDTKHSMECEIERI